MKGERFQKKNQEFMLATSRLLHRSHGHARAKAATPKPGSAIQHQSSRAEQAQGLLTDEPTVRKALLQIVIALEDNFHAREDLLQEALVHLWSSERQHPGQRRSWYLQSVKF